MTKNFQDKRGGFPGIIYALTMVVFLLAACASPVNQGSLVRTEKARNTFESSTIVPDHTYYYYGPQAEPEAIIALDNSYNLQNTKNYWVRVDITEKMLQDWNRMIDNNSRVRFPYWGSLILTPDGKQAGLWYASQPHTVIDFPSEDTIIIFTPSPTLEERERLPLRKFQ